MNENKEKRMIADTGYEVIRSFEIGDCELVIAENSAAADGQWYMKAEYSENGILGEYSRVVYSDDFTAVLEQFGEAFDRKYNEISREFESFDFQAMLIMPEECSVTIIARI